MWKFTRRSTQYTKVMRVMGIPSNKEKMFYLENDVGNDLEDTEVTHLEDKDKEEDCSRTILSNKVIKVIKVIKLIQVINKVTRGIHKDGINNVEISEVSQTLEEAITNLVTRWILVIMS